MARVLSYKKKIKVVVSATWKGVLDSAQKEGLGGAQERLVLGNARKRGMA